MMSKKAWSPGRMIRSVKLCGCGLQRSPGDRVDRLDAVGAHAVKPHRRQGDDVVLPDAGLERLGDVEVDAVDHGRRHVEQHQLVDALDLARLQHGLLRVAHVDAELLQLEHHRHLDDVDAERHVGDALFDQQRLDLARRGAE